MHKAVLAPVAALALVVSACGGSGTSDDAAGAADGSPRVVASFYPLREAAERVGGDRVSVDDLTPAGAEPHDLEVAPQQVEAINGADLVVVMGQGFQPAVERVAEGREGETLEVLPALGVGEGEVEAHDHAGEEDHAAGEEHAGEGEALDPHVWLDPTMMVEIVGEVAHHLAEVDPDGAEEYGRNAEAYQAELRQLDERFEETLSGCRHDLVVVQHEAFGWLTERYGLRQEGIAGLSPQQEPDPRRMAELVALVEEEGVGTVFTETLVSPRIAETLAREAGVETATLNPIEGLTDDDEAAGESYVSLMEANLESLASALDCS